MSSAPSKQGTLIVPYRFVTIFIIAHGEDLRDNPIDSFFSTGPEKGIYERFTSLFNTNTNKSNHYKLTVSGLTGNITNGSNTVDAIYSQIPRILAHNRTMSPLQKLYAVHEKMHSHYYFDNEVAVQSNGQVDFIHDRPNEYQRPQSRNENWFPEPTVITYDRAFYFTANPIKQGDRCRDAQERNDFGVWLLDASLDIATTIGLVPGCESEPLSLLNLLEIDLSTSRAHDSSDESGATITTLFTIMATLMLNFGSDIHINVIDVTCRYFNWDQYKPHAQTKHKIGRGVQLVGTALATISPHVGNPLLYAGEFLADEVPSAAATETGPYQTESVVLDGKILPVEKWYYDGKIKLSTLPNVWNVKGLAVTSTEISSTEYNLVRYSIGPHHQLIDTTTLFADDIHDIILKGSAFQNTTHDIEVFYVLRKSPKIMITLKPKPATMTGNPPRDNPLSYLGDHDTINAYLSLVKIETLSDTTYCRYWKITRQPTRIREPFFKQVYDTVVRKEAVARIPKLPRTDVTSSSSKKSRFGGRKKQKKRRTRRLRVKTNKSNKTRFRYSASYRKSK